MQTDTHEHTLSHSLQSQSVLKTMVEFGEGVVTRKKDKRKKEAGRMRTGEVELSEWLATGVAKLPCLDIRSNLTENANCRALSCSLPMRAG